MNDELDPAERLVPAAPRCAQCDGPLPVSIEQLAIVHSRDGELLTTCSVMCMAEFVSSLTRRTEPGAQDA